MAKGIYHKVESEIFRMIRDKEVAPGDRLPSERAMAGKFGVSRNTVREAIRALVEKGILSCRPNAGSFVTPDAKDRVADRIARDIGRQRRRLTEIFGVRKILEPAVAGLAAETITADELDELARILAGQEGARDKGADPGAWDMKFHEALVRSTGNSLLCSLFETLNSALSENRVFQSPERVGLSVSHHTRILAALRAGDKTGARRAMERHMAGMEEFLNLKIKDKLI